MPAFASLLAASAAARVASLNLCTDEYVLLLARPEQVVSVSYLSRDPLESSLWREARRHPGNRGSIEDVIGLRPTMMFTMGGVGGRATALLASRLHMRVVEVPYAANLGEIARNLTTVASALGNPEAAAPWVARLRRLQQAAPSSARDTIWVSGRGDSIAAGSLGAQWMRLAGFQQRSFPGGRVTLETIATKPPSILIRSDYRSGQMSGGARWLDHPIVRDAKSRQLRTDGRPWTCLGPLMIPEIERLQKVVR